MAETMKSIRPPASLSPSESPGLLDFSYQWFAANTRTAEARREFGAAVRNYWGEQDARDIYYQWCAYRDFSIGDPPGFEATRMPRCAR